MEASNVLDHLGAALVLGGVEVVDCSGVLGRTELELEVTRSGARIVRGLYLIIDVCEGKRGPRKKRTRPFRVLSEITTDLCTELGCHEVTRRYS